MMAASTPPHPSSAPALAECPTPPHHPRRRWQDHPFAAWALENGCLFGVALLRFGLNPKGSLTHIGRPLRAFLSNLAGGVLLIESMILAQMFLVQRVYAHLPYFHRVSSETRGTVWEMLKDWLTANARVHVFGSCLAVALAEAGTRGGGGGRAARLAEPGKLARALAERQGPFRLVPFLVKLAIMRVASDIVFYAAHWCLHLKGVYALVHKRHHEHKETRIHTNFHFSALDLLLEGFLPVFAGLAVMKTPAVRNVLRMVTGGAVDTAKVTFFEEYLLFAHIQVRAGAERGWGRGEEGAKCGSEAWERSEVVVVQARVWTKHHATRGEGGGGVWEASVLRLDFWEPRPWGMGGRGGRRDARSRKL